MDCSVTLITVPKRKHLLADVLLQLPENYELFEDTEYRGIKWSHYHALKKTFEKGTKWILLMQDDVKLASNFTLKLSQALDSAESKKIPFFQLFNSTTTRENALLGDPNWARRPGSSFLADVANVFHYTWARSFLRFYGDSYDTRRVHEFDLAIREFLVLRREPYYVRIPNLVDHLGVDSTVKHYSNKKCFSPTFEN